MEETPFTSIIAAEDQVQRSKPSSSDPRGWKTWKHEEAPIQGLDTLIHITKADAPLILNIQIQSNLALKYQENGICLLTLFNFNLFNQKNDSEISNHL